jgi:hypothetical protein
MFSFHRDPVKEQQLMALVFEAFDGVQLEGGVSLHKTIYEDNYGDITKAVALAIEKDETKDWKKLINSPQLLKVVGIGGISFFDAKGLRFHLPAYLCTAFEHPYADITASLLFTLTHKSDYNDKRLSLLNPLQKKCIGEILLYFRKLEDFEPDWKGIDQFLSFYLQTKI